MMETTSHDPARENPPAAHFATTHWSVVLAAGRTEQVSYSDGTPRVTPTLVGRTFTLNHQFPASGYFEVTMEVRDDEGAANLSRFRVITCAPALDLQRLSASTARISWSNHPAPFRLETSTQASAVNWQIVPVIPTLLNGRQHIDIGSTNAAEIFRLALP